MRVQNALVPCISRIREEFQAMDQCRQKKNSPFKNKFYNVLELEFLANRMDNMVMYVNRKGKQLDIVTTEVDT